MAGWVAGATLAAGALGAYSSYKSGKAQAKAAGKASAAQERAAQAGIAEQRRQFDRIQGLLKPYVSAGTGALQQQQALVGTLGAGKQRQAIAALEQSPQYQEMVRQQESAMLQNASATGGLRGGNIQSGLAQLRPALLTGLIEQQFARLGGLTSLGQNAAAGVGNAGMQTGGNIANLMQQAGAAQAGGILGQAQGQVNQWGGLGSLAGGLAFAGKTYGNQLEAQQNRELEQQRLQTLSQFGGGGVPGGYVERPRYFDQSGQMVFGSPPAVIPGQQ